ncbi:hypothetical protein AVEN_38986-1 [Araneus ventricosus]|uniref:Uncharacterized protein n=1 Tax=Araneus ventricosus TaxID=182803 RepID=A0A4Y2KMH5_ARAVE|nr:hypothetical protein AVEN_38986-1 [Araneus ventricosus]
MCGVEMVKWLAPLNDGMYLLWRDGPVMALRIPSLPAIDAMIHLTPDAMVYRSWPSGDCFRLSHTLLLTLEALITNIEAAQHSTQ